MTTLQFNIIGITITECRLNVKRSYIRNLSFSSILVAIKVNDCGPQLVTMAHSKKIYLAMNLMNEGVAAGK